MSKLMCVIVLFVSIDIAFGLNTGGGILNRIKNRLQPQPQDRVIYIEDRSYDDRPCKSSRCTRCRTDCYGNERCQNDCVVLDKCRTNCNGNNLCVSDCNQTKVIYVPEYDRCKSNQCNQCRIQCNGNDRCQSDCVVVDKCRANCVGNDQCINACGPTYTPVQYDRCSGCGTLRDDPILSNCESGKSLYYVQVPTTISVHDFVSNADLLRVYNESNLELNSDGISGRACLNDKIRFDLQHLNATIQPIADSEK